MQKPTPLIIELPKFTLVQRANRGDQWYVRFSFKGQKLLCCQTKNKTMAKEKAKELIVAHITKVSQEFRAASDESLSYASERWLTSKYLNNPPRTMKDMRSRLKVLLDALGTDVTKDLTKRLLEDTYQQLRKNRVHEAHYWKDLITAWMQLVNWMIEEGLIPDVNYFRNILVPKSETFRMVDDIISNTHLKLLVPEFPKIDQEWIWVMRLSSMNPADLWELKKKHIIVDDDPKSQTGYKLVKLRAKAKSSLEEHKLPISKELWKYLKPRWEKLEDNEDRLYDEFISEDTEHKFTNNFSARWVVRYRRIFPKLKRKKLTILRHCFITEQILNKVERSTLKKWVGHSPKSVMIDWVYDHNIHTADEMR